jgi:hypothetical protein
MSASVAIQSHHTPEDLLSMPDGKSYELIGSSLIVERVLVNGFDHGTSSVLGFCANQG